MEFWGTEVPPGKPQVNAPGEGTYLHVSQAALGPSKDNKSERVVIRVEAGGKNVVLGTLVSGKVDQMSLDLIFDREFKLSHTSTSCSVFICGYKTEKMADDEMSSDEESQEMDDSEDDDKDVPQAVLTQENGTAPAKEKPKPTKKEVKVVEKVVQAEVKKPELSKSGLIDKEASEGSSEEDDDVDDELDDEEAGGAPEVDVKMDFDSDADDEEDDSDFELGDDSDDLSDEEGSEEDSEGDSDEDGSSDDEDEGDEDVAAPLGTKRALASPSSKSAVGGKKPRLDTPAKPGSQTDAEYWESLIIARGTGLITAPGKKVKAAAPAETTPVTGGKKSAKKEAPLKTPPKTPKTPQQKPAKDGTPKTPSTGGDSAKKLGAYHCAECKRNFATESGLTQHSAAKHKT